MKKLFLFTTLIVVVVLVVSCSTKDAIELEPVDLIIENETSDASRASCGAAVNFKDLVVETSWISGETGDRDTFDACGVDGKSWMDKYNSGVVMMKCLKGKGHRTELKEEPGSESSLLKRKKLEFTAKYTRIAKNGVTIAQIHNRGSGVRRPWVRVYIDDDRYVKIKETRTNPTGSSSSYNTFIGPKYTSGDNLTVRVLTSKGKAKFRITTAGEIWNKTVQPSSSWSSKSDSYYLKAGVYTEGSDKTPTVKYSAFTITH